MKGDNKNRIADIYHALSKGVLIGSAEPAIRGLLSFKGFSKTEKDVWRFLAEKADWFADQREAWATATDEKVLSDVAKNFKDFMKADQARQNPELGKPWKPCRLPEDKQIDDLEAFDYSASIYLTEVEVKLKEKSPLHVFQQKGRPSRQERATEQREMKRSDGYKVLKYFQRWAKRTKTETPRFFLEYFKRRLKHEIACQGNPELRQESLRRSAEVIYKALRKNI